MIYYIYEFTNNIFQTVNYFIIVSYNKIYDSISNYLIPQSNNNKSLPKLKLKPKPKPKPKPINIEHTENKKKYIKVIKSYSYNILPNNIDNINNSVILDIYEVDESDNLEIYKFDYTVKYLSTDKLYGWYIDIEEKEKFISPIK
jgi:hypothetical protein